MTTITRMTGQGWTPQQALRIKELINQYLDDNPTYRCKGIVCDRAEGKFYGVFIGKVPGSMEWETCFGDGKD